MARTLGRVLGRLIVFLLVWVGLALLTAAVLIRIFWGQITVGQLLLNLVSVETAGGGGSVVWICILGIGVAPLLITAGLALWQARRRRRRSQNADESLPQRPPWIARTASAVLAFTVVIGGTASFAGAVSLGDYLEGASSRYELDDYYVEPTVTGDEDRRNLVLIYLESGEATLGDEKLFEKDIFAPLEEVTRAEDGWQTVEGLRQYEGGGWTMAGLTSTQCGVPLGGLISAASSVDLNELRVGDETYLAGTTCLGDVLEERGYTSVFLGGANPSFAAKDSLLSSHGYSEVKGLSDWIEAGEPKSSFRSDWGLSDERLMAHAKEELDALHAEAERTGEPFNLSVLTLDTHEPVHVHDYCPVDTEDEATSVFGCSMKQVAGFVDHMEKQGHLEDTAVVIMGDHLKPADAGDAFHAELDANGDRTIFNRIWVPGEKTDRELRAGVDQLSMYPTILEAAGLTLEDGEAGVGVSAFATEVPAGSAQSLAPEDYTELLKSRSAEFYAEAWTGHAAAE
ncbi:hypothetical protein GCM10009672_03960 [Nesterenkonia lutea]